MKKIAFFGHRTIVDSQRVKILIRQILKEKIEQGYGEVLVGKHGDFDKIVLLECLEYKKNIDENLKISCVSTSLKILKGQKGVFCKEQLYETIVYEIEEVYFKNRINFSNRKMVDESELVVCYVDMNKGISGAKNAVKYAKKLGKQVINLFVKIENENIGL